MANAMNSNGDVANTFAIVLDNCLIIRSVWTGSAGHEIVRTKRLCANVSGFEPDRGTRFARPSAFETGIRSPVVIARRSKVYLLTACPLPPRSPASRMIGMNVIIVITRPAFTERSPWTLVHIIISWETGFFFRKNITITFRNYSLCGPWASGRGHAGIV